MTLEQRRKIARLLALFTATLLIIGVVFGISHENGIRQHEKDLLAQQQAAFAKTANADPILKYLPYGTLDYNINPTFKTINGKRQVVLQIEVLLTGADYKQSSQALQDTIKTKQAEAISYIKSVGFDPSKYVIDYLSTTP